MPRLWCGCLRHLLHLLHLCHLLHPCRFWYLLLPQQLPTNAHPSMVKFVKTILKCCTPHETVWWSYWAVWICICDFYGFTSQPRAAASRGPHGLIFRCSLILHDFCMIFRYFSVISLSFLGDRLIGLSVSESVSKRSTKFFFEPAINPEVLLIGNLQLAGNIAWIPQIQRRQHDYIKIWKSCKHASL